MQEHGDNAARLAVLDETLTAVRLLCALAGGSFAHFELPAGAVSQAVRRMMRLT